MIKGLKAETICCNCSKCGKIIIVQESGSLRRRTIPRINDRPICRDCLCPKTCRRDTGRPTGCTAGMHVSLEDLDALVPLTEEQTQAFYNGSLTNEHKEQFQARIEAARMLKYKGCESQDD